jgi:GAF domain-containing protein
MSTENLKILQEEIHRLTEENRRLQDELQAIRRSVQALSELYSISQDITPDTDVVKLLGEILDAALTVLKASDGSLLLLDEQNGDLVFTVVRGASASKLTGYRLPKGAGIAGWVAANRRPQIVLDVRRDPRFFSKVDESFGFQTRTLVSVPVQLDNGRVLGVIEALNKTSDREFNQDDLELLLIVAQLAATAMRRAERAAEVIERRSALLQKRPPTTR